MMKKITYIVLSVLFVILSSIGLMACGRQVTSISVDSLSSVYYVDEFNIDNYSATITYSDESEKIVPLRYVVKAEDKALFTTVGKQTINLSYERYSTKLYIEVFNHDFSNLKFVDKSVTYDGTEKEIAVSNVPSGARVEYNVSNKYTSAGVYTVTATVSMANYNDKVLSATLTINKAKVNKPTNNNSYTFNGKEQTFTLTEDSCYTIYNNKRTIAGSQEVIVSLKDKDNYEWFDKTTDDLKYTFTIKKATYNMNNVTFEDVEYKYDGQIKNISVQGNLPQGVSVTYTNNKQSKVGQYLVTASFTGDTENYNLISNKTAFLTITKVSVDKPISNTQYYYTGEEQTFNIADSSYYTILNNIRKEIGSQVVTVSLNDKENYEWSDRTNADIEYSFIINKATYDMSKVSFTGATVTYDGQVKKLEISGELPQGVTVSYTNNEKVNAGSYSAIASFSGDTEHYNEIPKISVTFIIEKAVVEKPVNTSSYYYNGEEQEFYIAENSLYTVYNNKRTDAGKQSVTVRLNDQVNYKWTDNKSTDLTFSFVIEKAVVEKPEHSNSYVYNGKEQTVDIAENVNYSIINGKRTDAGYQTVTVKLNDSKNYQWEDGSVANVYFTFTINKAQLTKPKENTNTFIYSGKDQTYNLAENSAYSITNNTRKNAGSQKVTVSIIDKVNYQWEDGLTSNITFDFVINKAKITIPQEDKTVYTYNGKEQTYVIAENSLYKVTNNTRTIAGSQNVMVSILDKDNYSWISGDYNDLTYVFTIVKATYDMSKVSFNNATFDYNKQSHKIEIAGELPQGVTVSYANNEKTDAGIYNAVASFSVDVNNFNLIEDKTATLTINKAKIEKPKADETVFTYNGNTQTYTIAENEGYSVSNNTRTNAGEQTVIVAIPSSNYEWADGTNSNLEYKFTINKASYDMSNVYFVPETFKYDGLPKSIFVTGELPQGVLASYIGNAQIEKGEYTVTAIFNGDKENYNEINSKVASITITREEHFITFRQEGFVDVIKTVLDLATFTDIPTPEFEAGYNITWENVDLTSVTKDILVCSTKSLVEYNIIYENTLDSVNRNPLTYNIESDTIVLENLQDLEFDNFIAWKNGDNYITEIPKGSYGDITLTVEWFHYGLNEIQYDKTKTAIKVTDNLTTEFFNASCVDIDGNPADISLTVKGILEGGKKITVQFEAKLNNKTRVLTVQDIEVYDVPTITINENSHINISTGSNYISWFNAKAFDSFGRALVINVETAESYKAGDVIDFKFSVTDKAGNETSIERNSVSVFDLPSITCDESITVVKQDDIDVILFDTLNSDSRFIEYFNVKAYDSFKKELKVKVTSYSNDVIGGEPFSIIFYANDGKGNGISLSVKVLVYGTPYIEEPEDACVSESDIMTDEILALKAYDSFGEELKTTYTLKSGEQKEGDTLVYTYTACDKLGNVAIKNISYIVYGKPIVSVGNTELNFTQEVNASTLKATAKDSFDKILDVVVELVKGDINKGGRRIYSFTATDKLGNSTTIEEEIVFYKKEEIQMSIENFGNDIIKVTSNGEEFVVTSLDSIGNACEISIRPAEGYSIVAGEKISLYIVAKDKFGNEKISNIFNNVSVYGTPKLVRIIDNITPETDFTKVYTVKDSFDTDLEATFEVLTEQPIVKYDMVEIKITAQDFAGNKLETIKSVCVDDGFTVKDGVLTKYVGSVLSVELPDTISKIGDNAFSGNTTLETIEIPTTVTEIGKYAFKGCTSLKTITISKNVEIIGEGAFANCTALESLVIPKTVQKIGEGVLLGCNNIVDLTIPFVGAKVVLSSDTEQYPFGYIFGSTAFAGAKSTSQSYYGLVANSTISTLYYIPASLKTVKLTGGYIPYGAFQNVSLDILELGKDITGISSRAFTNASITIVTTIVSQPDTWESNWNSNCKVFYNFTGKEITYSFNTNGGNNIESISAVILRELPTATQEGYHFLYWETSEGVKVELPYVGKGNETFVAKWMSDEQWNSLYEGTTFDYAKEITASGKVTVSLAAGAKYYFVIKPTANGTLTVTSSGKYDTYGYLYNSAQKQVKADDDSAGSSQFKLTYSVKAGETYYVAVKILKATVSGSFDVNFSM